MRFLVAGVLVVLVFSAPVRAEETPAAQRTREKLGQKVTVTFDNEPLGDVVADLRFTVKGLRIYLDAEGGVSRNQRITYAGTDVTLDEALKGMLDKVGLTYTVTSKRGDAYDGYIKIAKK